VDFLARGGLREAGDLPFSIGRALIWAGGLPQLGALSRDGQVGCLPDGTEARIFRGSLRRDWAKARPGSRWLVPGVHLAGRLGHISMTCANLVGVISVGVISVHPPIPIVSAAEGPDELRAGEKHAVVVVHE
jgi:hypothetical protein